jgi:hypothetical protein
MINHDVDAVSIALSAQDLLRVRCRTAVRWEGKNGPNRSMPIDSSTGGGSPFRASLLGCPLAKLMACLLSIGAIVGGGCLVVSSFTSKGTDESVQWILARRLGRFVANVRAGLLPA